MNPQNPSTNVTINTNSQRRRGARRRRNNNNQNNSASKARADRNSASNRQQVTYPDLLSVCARDYVSAMEDPWSGKIACIPTLPSVPSRKVRYWSKGVFSAAAGGFGFIAFNPFAPTNNSTGSSEYAVIHSDSTYAGNTIVNTGTGVNSSQLNSEFSTTTITSVRYRLVSAGLQVRYAGTRLNMGGRVFMVEEPDHETLVGQGVTDITKYDTHRIFQIQDSRWKGVTYHPCDEDEFDYLKFSDRGTNMFLGAIIVPPGSSDIPLEMEFWCSAVYELIGQGARGTTPTPVDLVGLSAIQTYSNTVPNRTPKEGERSTIVRQATNAVGRLLWEMGSGIIRNYFPPPVPARLPIGSNAASVRIEEILD